MLRICEKLCEADERGRTHGLARAETVYLRALVDAMADMDSLQEIEVLKSLGDVNLEKGRLGKDVEKFDCALKLYTAALIDCEEKELGEVIVHRCRYAEMLLQGLSFKGSQCMKRPSLSKSNEETSPAKVAAKFQDLDKKSSTGSGCYNDSVIVGYAQLMVEGIVNENSILETEAIKSLGDVYLERGRETGDTKDVTKATALYNTALERCNDSQGTVAIVHRLLHAAKIRQHIIKRSLRRQRQRFTGQQDYLHPSFSATPTTSDVINISTEMPTKLTSDENASQEKGDTSYQKYLQTADCDLKSGDLDGAEKNLASALRIVHDPSKPSAAKEADCLCRLGDVYVERGKKTEEGRKFTQAAALYNASMARKDDNKQDIIARLQETERQFLCQTCKINGEPYPYSSALDHRKELDSIRARAKSQLEAIHQEHNPYQYDEDDPVVREVEVRRAEAIKSLFKKITYERQQFIQLLTDECIGQLGPPPCKYAFIGLGSQATELVTPYSDLEFAILIEEGKDNDHTRRYFLNLTHYLHLKVINLGETILPAMAIPSLNDFQSGDPEKDWYFDSVTPRGFSFDGFMPWACKTPFGREKTKSKPPVSLIQTPAKLVEYQHLHIALTEGYHLSDILRRVSYLTGDEELVNEYMVKVDKCFDRSPLHARLLAAITLQDDIKHADNLEPTDQLVNVKKELYRFPTVVLDMLSFSRGIVTPSVWATIEELYKTRRISRDEANHLNVLISISAELRLRTYIANGGQKDTMSPLAEIKNQEVDDNLIESVFYIPDSKMLFRYYYTAIPLKRYFTDTIAMTNPATKMFPTAIFDSSSETRAHIAETLLHLDASLRYWEAALEEAGNDKLKRFEILFGLGNVWQTRGDCEKAISYFKQALELGANTASPNDHASLLHNIGLCWSDLGDQSKAISYYEESLEMKKAIYGDNTAHPDIASTLNNIGLCWGKLGNQTKAISYHEQALEMKKTVYMNNAAHPDIAESLHNIGSCWIELGDGSKALTYLKQSLEMRKAIYGCNTAHPYIASSLNMIGLCWNTLGDQMKAISCFEQSMKMKRAIYGDNKAHPSIAGLLNNIGSCWNQLGDSRTAKSYFEQSMNMAKAIYGNSEAHPHISASLTNIGGCWSDLGDQRKALSYHYQSLNMMKAIYGINTAHPDVASSLSNIGSCWRKLGDQRKALNYHEQSLKMLKSIFGNNTAHPYIASQVDNIGSCWSDLGDQRKAISYFEHSLEMNKAIHGNNTPHSSISTSLNCIGTCWSRLGDPRKAISYHEQSLDMMKAIYEKDTTHPDIALTLDSIGSCLSDLGDQRKAISYFEQSIDMKIIIYGDNTAHPNIAKSLNNIGSCWYQLGDQGRAISYFEQSVDMNKIIYGDNTAHPDIAESLNNIGSCWSDLGNQRKAISYLEEALEMRKVIHGENTAHPDIALSLNNIGRCWSSQGDKTKAVSYYEESLKMMKAIYGDNTAHPYIASSLNNIGSYWDELGDLRKAIRYYEESLKIRCIIFGDNNAHPDIASSLDNIGSCWGKLGDRRKALTYQEKSLTMRKAIYGNRAHPDIASSLNNIGRSWGDLGDQTKAVTYYEQSLQMRKAIYGDNNAHPDIASSLNNIGTCWDELGDQRKAISYYKESLEMRKGIHGDNTAHAEIATSLNNIGTSWDKLGDEMKALGHFQQSLEMWKTIYGNGTTHPDLAASLNNIGTCLGKLGDQKTALSYFRQSLKMRKTIYGNNTAHPDIARSLSNIGVCWGTLGDYRKAVSYFEQSLTMMKAIYGDTSGHPNFVPLLNNIRICRSALSN